MQIRYFSALLAASFIASASFAQNLTKEIIVEREVEPAERAANRPNGISPSILTPPLQRFQLKTAEYGGTGQLNRQVIQLEPAAWADTFRISPYRGYASAAYFPALNIAASAGYRIINKANTRLGAWLQYDGSSYHQPTWAMVRPAAPEEENVTLKRHTFSVGAYLGQYLGLYGILTADARYTMGTFSQPMVQKDYDQTVTAASLAVDWTDSPANRWTWRAGASIDHFGFDKSTPVLAVNAPAVGETAFAFRGSLGRRWSRHAWALDASASFQHLNHTGALAPEILGYEYPEGPVSSFGMNFVPGNSATYGLITVRPRYDVTYGALSASLSAGADITTGQGTDVRFSSRAHVTFAPVAQFAAWADFATGRVLNRLQGLFDFNPYQLSCLTYTPSTTTDVKAGLTVGPFKGFSLQLWGGYNKASDWLMPALAESHDFYLPTDLSGIYYGARIQWQLRNIVELHLQGEGAPSDLDKGYYAWRDHARWVLDAGVTVRPIKPLSVGIAYNLRTQRSAYLVTPLLADNQFVTSQASMLPLGNTGSLNVDARYAITPAFSVFANLENLLCRRWRLAPQVLSQRMHGLVGVSVKF